MSKPLYALIMAAQWAKNEQLVQFARDLFERGYALIGSRGTVAYLGEHGVTAKDLSEYVGGGPILGHRVVSISREIAAGLLSNLKSIGDMDELQVLGLPVIDLAYVSWYDMVGEIAKGTATRESVIEMTDVGGPTAVWEAAKGRRVVICDPADIEPTLAWMDEGRPNEDEYLDHLAAKAAFTLTNYTLASARYTSHGEFDGLLMELVAELAYAENRNQNPASLHANFRDNGDPLAIHRFKIESGQPSFITLADGNTILNIMVFLAEACRQTFNRIPFIVIAGKHANACGIGVDWDDPATATNKALLGDPVAVMGGEVIANFAITDDLGELLMHTNGLIDARDNWGLDVLLAPSFSEATIELLGHRAKRRLLSNLALLNPSLPQEIWAWKQVRGGWLKQRLPNFILTPDQINHWTTPLASNDYFLDLLIAWAAAWFATSNSVALAKDRALLALGCGQQDRIRCTWLSIVRARLAGHQTVGSYFASDGFFPYAASKVNSGPLPFDDWELILKEARRQLQGTTPLEARRLLGELALQLISSDHREGTELLVDAGCVGGIVPADGKEVERVKAFFAAQEMSVGFIDPENRGFAKH